MHAISIVKYSANVNICYIAGLNSGVMLMNLTRLRANPWIEDLAKILKNYKEHVRLGDQDLLNILFHFKPGK